MKRFPTRPACVFEAWCYRSGRAMVKYPGIQKNAHTQNTRSMPVGVLLPNGPCTQYLRSGNFAQHFFTVCAYCSHAVNTHMLVRVLLTYAVMTTCAFALHDNTFAVFELREQLLRLTLNLWELLDQLRYASDPLRQRVYLDIAVIQSEIRDTIAELLRLDSQEHPASE